MKTDQQLKSEVSAELDWDPTVESTGIGVAVNNGVVTLSGQVETFLQKHAGERVVRRVAGVRGIALDLEVHLAPHATRTDAEVAQTVVLGVTDKIRLKQRANPSDIRSDIESALTRHAQREARRIEVDVEGSVVTLRGTVESIAELDAVMGTARASRGVTRVVDRLEVVD